MGCGSASGVPVERIVAHRDVVSGITVVAVGAVKSPSAKDAVTAIAIVGGGRPCAVGRRIRLRERRGTAAHGQAQAHDSP